MLELKQQIQSKVRVDMDKQQREYYLNQQLRTIQEELGGSPNEQDVKELTEKAAKKKWSKEVAEAMNKDIKAQRLVGATDKQVSTFNHPIEYEYVPMFNTQSGFATFLIPAVLVLLIQQTMVLGVGMMAGEEREKKRRGILEPHVWCCGVVGAESGPDRMAASPFGIH